MSEQQIKEQITIKNAHTHLPIQALWLLIPIEAVGVFAFISYVGFHWHLFIQQTTAIVAWLALVASIAAYIALAYLLVRVVRSAIDALIALMQGLMSAYKQFEEARSVRATYKLSQELLHTGNNVVVYRSQAGEIVVQQIEQAKYNYNIKQVDTSAAAPMAQLPPPGGIQSFQQLLLSGVVTDAIKQGKMILGYVNGTLRLGDWLDLYSCGIGGTSGTGKSTTVRFLLFQVVLAHGLLMMIDPHINDPDESLAAQLAMFKEMHLMPPCDDNPGAVAKRIVWLKKEVARRIAKKQKGTPIIFVLDEFNALMRRLPDELKKELVDLLLTIEQEGRKFGVYAMLLAQRWSEQDLGGKNYGAAIRTSLASKIAHRFTDEDQAKKFFDSKNGPKLLDLAQGIYLFRDTQGKVSETTTPATYASDGTLVLQMLQGESSQETTKFLPERAVESDVLPAREKTTGELEKTSNGHPETTDIHTLARQVTQLLAKGTQKPEIMRQLWQVNPGASDAYKQANLEYQQVMAYIAEQL